MAHNRTVNNLSDLTSDFYHDDREAIGKEGFFFAMDPRDPDGMDMDEPASRVNLSAVLDAEDNVSSWDDFCGLFGDEDVF